MGVINNVIKQANYVIAAFEYYCTNISHKAQLHLLHLATDLLKANK